MTKLLLYCSHCLRWGIVLLSLLGLGCTSPEMTDQADKLALARAHLRAERYHSALSLLHDIQYTEENIAELYLMQAMAYFKLEDFPHAATAIEQAQPRSPGLQIFLAYLYLLVGDFERAGFLADDLAPHHRELPELALLRGNISLKAHQYQEAERHFRAVLVMEQTAVKAYIGLGHSALLQYHLGKAEEYYLHALFLSRDEISPQLALVNLYLAIQRYDDAEETLKLALATYPGDLMLQMSLISLYIKTYRSHEATNLLESILASMPFSDYVKTLATRQYLALDRLDDAYKLINGILSSNSSSYYGLSLYGEYLFRQGKYELALNSFHKAISKNSNSFIANYYIGAIHLRSKNYRLATYFLEKSLQAYPGSSNAHLLMGVIYLQSQKYALASEYANAVLKVHPGDVDAHLMNGIALYLQGYFDVAKYEFNVVELFAPQNLSAKVCRALVELEQHHPKEAEKFLTALVSSVTEQIFFRAQILQEHGIETLPFQQQLEWSIDGDHDPLAWLILGHVYYSTADYRQAEVAYRHAMGESRANVLSYYAMAQVEVKRANRRQAMAYLEQAVAINPAFTKSYRALGSLYEQEKNYQQARVAYKRGLQYAPDDPTLLNNFAWAHLMAGGDVGTAYVHIRKAITLAPEDLDLQDTLAWWYYLTHDYPQAIALLKKIVKAQPEHAIYRYHLGMAYLESDAKEQAREHLQRALNLGIDAEHRSLIEEHMP